MSSRTLRRRLHHGDVDGGRHDRYETSRLDALKEPLLADGDYDCNKDNEVYLLLGFLDQSSVFESFFLQICMVVFMVFLFCFLN